MKLTRHVNDDRILPIVRGSLKLAALSDSCYTCNVISLSIRDSAIAFKCISSVSCISVTPSFAMHRNDVEEEVLESRMWEGEEVSRD